MANQHEQQGFFNRADAAVTNALTGAYNAVMRDGTIAAFFRQGVKELGEAFGQMLPDSIQVSEPGSVWNPLYSDIAADKRQMQELPGVSLPSPSDIGRDAQAGGTVRGDVQKDSKDLPSPSEIGRQQWPDTPPDHDHDHGRDR